MGGGSRISYPAAFDGYRGLIILAIAVLHITLLVAWVPHNEFLRSLRGAGFFTVEFLFVVTGFAFMFPVAARGTLGSARAYAFRRVVRIVPAYLISLVATVLVASAVERPELPLGDVATFAAHLVFAHHELGVSGFGINAVFWILSIIALFYALAPFIWRPYLRHPLIGLGLAIAVVIVWREVVRDDLTYLQFRQFPLFLADFAIGMTAAWAFFEIRRRDAHEWLARHAVAITLGALALLTALLYQVGHERASGEILRYGESTIMAFAIPITFIVVMCATTFMPSWAQAPLSNRAIQWTGEVSYGVFLFHVLILRLAIEVLGIEQGSGATVLLLMAIVIPLSLFVGWLSYRYVEEPAREWARSREHRAAAGAVVPAGQGSS